MSVVAIVYFSGYGHTAKQAEAVADGVRSARRDRQGLSFDRSRGLAGRHYLGGCRSGKCNYLRKPDILGGPAWQFKKFADACSSIFRSQTWKNKIAAGFTNSAAVSGDKFATVSYFWTLAMQLGQIWVGTGLLPAAQKSSTPADVNWSSGFAGAHAISPADASVEEAPRNGDLETAKQFGKRVAELARKLS